ncbi:MAG: DNA translocase FtsK 4TM domain-containing protein [Peptoniphilus sp.]|nr:DNA translocase FtsK 4TM domain-containing protein [Peptoniphilus sp.]
MRKKISKKPMKSANKNINKEYISIIFILLGLLSLISLFSSKMGIIGNILYKIFTFLFGSGNFIFPLLFIIWGILLGLKSFQENFNKILISNIVITLCILVFLDGTKTSDLTLVDRISLSVQYLDIATSGGIIGSILGFFMYKLFGSIGTYTILSVIIIFSLYIFLRYTHEFFGKIVNFVKIFFDKLKNLSSGLSEKLNNKREEPELNNFFELVDDADENSLAGDLEDSNSVEKEKKPIIEKDITIKDFVKEDKQKRNLKEVGYTKEELIEEKKEIENNLKALKNSYSFPQLNLLNKEDANVQISKNEIMKNRQIIEETMENFGIESKIVAINRGPAITCYELEPAPGVKLSKIVALNDNLALSLATSEIRIEAPIPGKSAVGIEVPNKKKQSVSIREIIGSNEFKNLNSDLPLALGKDVSGSIIISSIDKMPHLLIAGATGSGKSVCINTIITSILFKSSPDEVKLMLIDPKVVELNVYNGIPHLLIPVVTDPKKAAFALNWAVGEMEKRYKLFAENSVRDLKSFNNKILKTDPESKLPKIVIIIDELADLMMVAQSEVEDYIARLAQMARAAGIYLIIATQRPSVDVITGTIKANIPSRIAFSVSSSVDSRTILDAGGAEKLLGKGDMLFHPGFISKPIRVQGAFISDEEVENVVDYVKENSKYDNVYEDKIKNEMIETKKNLENANDPLFDEALKYIITDEQASISYLQRKLKIGYSRAARIVDQMEELGILGPHEGSKPRKILLTDDEINEILGEKDE